MKTWSRFRHDTMVRSRIWILLEMKKMSIVSIGGSGVVEDEKDNGAEDGEGKKQLRYLL